MATSRKKILYIITKSNFGGAQRYVYELATGLPPDRYEVVVACGGHGRLTQRLRAAGVRTHVVESFARDIDVLKELRAARELWRICRAERPDIVHLNSSKAGGLGAVVARLSGVPHIVFTAHGWPFYEHRSMPMRIALWLFSYLTVLLAHQTIVVSQHDLVRARMPFVTKRLVHIPTAIPLIVFKDRNAARAALIPPTLHARQADRLWAVSTGEFTHNKNLRTLLDALYEVNRTSGRKVFLTLIGEGEERAMLEAYAASHALTEYVYFAGFVEDARSYLTAFDVFLLPSLKEGLPYGLLEAGAAGLGCIASAVGGIPEIIRDPGCGILIDPCAPTDIAQALARYANDAALVELHGVALRERVTAAFDMAVMLRDTQALYEAALTQ